MILACGFDFNRTKDDSFQYAALNPEMSVPDTLVSLYRAFQSNQLITVVHTENAWFHITLDKDPVG